MTQFLTVTMGFWFHTVGWSVAAAAAAAATTNSGVTRVLGAREQNQWSAPSPNVFFREGGARGLKVKCSATE